MPVNNIKSSNRAKSAIAAALVVSIGSGASILFASATPTAVKLSVNTLIKPWEGLVLTSHWDKYSKRYDICHGDTLIDGKPVKAGMRKTEAQCDAILMQRVLNDYYKPLTRCIAGFEKLPVSLQASLISGAYNFGVGALCKSRAAKLSVAGAYHTACLAQTAFNRAGGQVVNGLVLRREMGDAQRIGEAELCVSGLST